MKIMTTLPRLTRLPFEELALLATDDSTPTPDRFAEMHDEPFTCALPRKQRQCKGVEIVVVHHSDNSITTEAVPCTCEPYWPCSEQPPASYYNEDWTSL